VAQSIPEEQKRSQVQVSDRRGAYNSGLVSTKEIWESGSFDWKDTQSSEEEAWIYIGMAQKCLQEESLRKEWKSISQLHSPLGLLGQGAPPRTYPVESKVRNQKL
jgi:hypothetical protein